MQEIIKSEKEILVAEINTTVILHLQTERCQGCSLPEIEATGNLDTRTSFEILVLFQKLHAAGRTILFVTHNPDIANYSSRNIMLRDGHVISDEYNHNIHSAAEGLAALPANSDE